MRAQVTVKIKENQGTSFEFRDLELPDTINVSKLDSIFDNRNSGARGFQLSRTKTAPICTLDGAYGYFAGEGYAGYISQQTSDKSCVFSPTLRLQFYISGNAPKHLYVIFDTVANEYATNFILSTSEGQIAVSSNTSAICRINVAALLLPENTDGTVVNLDIIKWSNAYKSAKVTLLSSAFVGVFTGKDLKSFTCSENTFNEQMSIAPGIIAQYADISVYDRNNYLHNLAHEGVLTSETDVTLEAVTDDGSLSILGTYRVSTWDVQITSSTVAAECTDITSTLEKINVPQQPVVERTLDDMLIMLFQFVRNAGWRYFDDDTAQYCKNIVTPDNWFYPSTLYDLLNKICILGMLRIYWHIDGYIVTRCW